MSRAVTAVLLGAALALLAAPALAGAPRERAEKKESDFWSDLAEPGHKQFVQAMRRGREHFEAAVKMSPRLRARTLEDAVSAFQDATRRSPRNPDGFFWLGKSLYHLDRMKEAIAAFKQVRRLKPDFADDYSICFKLGIAYSKLGRFEESVGEYDRAERILSGAGGADTRSERAVLHGNAAEALMALGRLDESIQRYLESISLQPGNILAWWGLAVAYDRDEQISKSREAVARALSYDQNMSRLTADSVFFIPEGDIHYYYALGYLGKGDGAAAKREWESFLVKLGDNQWAFRAREHLAQLGAAPAATGKGKRLAPVPKAGAAEGDSSAYDQSSARYRIQGYLYRIRLCYQKELKAKPQLAGQLRIGFTITKEGKVQDLKVVSSTVRKPSLHTCVMNTVKTIYFNRPSSNAAVKVTFPMEFKPVQ